MFFLATCAGSLVLGLMLAYVYGKHLSDQGHPGAEEAFRNAAINLTVVIAMAVLLLAPAGPLPWFKRPPVKGLYMTISQNLKPKDKKGRGWLAAQTYSNKKEAQTAVWFYGLIHKTLTAALCAGVLGGLSALCARPLSNHLGGEANWSDRR